MIDRQRAARGFTLVEVLVALLLLGIMTALGYGTYRQARISAERAEQSQARTREIEFGLRIMVQDFAQIAPRPIRATIGSGRDPALHSSGIKLGAGSSSSSDTATLVELTRAGWSNSAGVQRGSLQRVSFQLDKETLKRLYQTVLDPTLSNKPVEQELLTKVKSVQMRYLDRNRVWTDSWPAPGVALPDSLYVRPVAIELTIEFKDWGTVRRLVEVAG